MKFASSAASRKTKRRIKRFLILLAVLVGCLFAAEGRFAVMRVNNIDVVPSDLLPERVVWGTLSARQEACWPLLASDAQKYTAFLEKYYPVKAKLSLTGWGRFKLAAKPLVPAFRMYWGGTYWYVDADGLTWLAVLPENKYVDTGKCHSRPLLSWGSDRSSPLDLAAEDGNIYLSRLPLPRIMEWYKIIESMGWTRRIKYIQAGVAEKLPVVRLIFYNAEGGEGVNVVFVDDPSSWRDTARAVKKLYPDVAKFSSRILMDTTYKGKILVKSIVQ